MNWSELTLTATISRRGAGNDFRRGSSKRSRQERANRTQDPRAPVYREPQRPRGGMRDGPAPRQLSNIIGGFKMAHDKLLEQNELKDVPETDFGETLDSLRMRGSTHAKRRIKM